MQEVKKNHIVYAISYPVVRIELIGTIAYCSFSGRYTMRNNLL